MVKSEPFFYVFVFWGHMEIFLFYAKQASGKWAIPATILDKVRLSMDGNFGIMAGEWSFPFVGEKYIWLKF